MIPAFVVTRPWLHKNRPEIFVVKTADARRQASKRIEKWFGQKIKNGSIFNRKKMQVSLYLPKRENKSYCYKQNACVPLDD
jgi:hypothetical protein